MTNNQGRLAKFKVKNLQPLEFELLSVKTAEPAALVTVCLPLIEQDRLEWAVEKLTELNIAKLRLITTEYTQVQELKLTKFGRLTKAALAAQKQCGRATPLTILPPVPLHQIDYQAGAIKIIAAPKSDSSIKDVLSELSPLSWKYIIVGPEGGLTEAEESTLMQGENVFKANLGEIVLRAETAAVVLATLARF
jgi:16S rRNA (uracil1498-N3)-methyltransferase